MKATLLLISAFLLQLATGCCVLSFTTPVGLRERRIVVGEGFLLKSTFFQRGEDDSPRMNFVEGLTEIKSAEDSEHTVAVTDNRHIWFVDVRTREARVLFRDKNAGDMHTMVPVDIEGDGTLEVMCRGGGFGDVGLLDHNGKLLWKKSGGYDGDFTAHWMSSGDLDRNGELEFYIAATDGLYCYDARGTEVWGVGRGNDYHHVEVFDNGDDARRRIVSQIGSEFFKPAKLEFRDHAGDLVSGEGCKAGYASDFRVLKWPTDGSPLRLLIRVPSGLIVTDDKCKVVWRYTMPRSFGWGYGVEGTFVRFSDREEPYLAVLLGSRAAYRRTVLCVFSLQGDLVYQEVLGATRGLLATRLDRPDRQGELLLTGDGLGKVVSYELAR